MLEVPVDTVQRLRMSWEEYERLPEWPRTEWVDGEVLVMPPTAARHASAAARLIMLLGRAFPDLDIGTEGGLWLPRNRLRGPDVMMAESRTDETFRTVMPLLVAEVLSPSTRAEDTIRKPMEYAEGGVERYWIVDPDLRTIDALLNVDGAWETEAHLDDREPVAEIVIGDHGGVVVDLREVLR
ncbi:Uma2 family endonuclease [Nocardioides sp. LHD-245]|uniref:Uma2 family endonuclease n=1 Tax=Nocardioides sp. LHD-245 TaxID=3051387 RepID=UPI0027E18A7D|nr:Uma2 family endonuclease [Nocardioides sp. LHD-245]